MNKKFNRSGILFVVSAPSGTGKTTLCNNLRQTPDLAYSVSCTTRAPRPGEENGVDYLFLSHEQFQEKIANNGFVEYAKVHSHYYGTPLDQVLFHLRAGTDVLLDIDVQGARSIRNHTLQEVRDSVADVFIMPPTVEELERRLRKRGTESEEQIAERLKTASAEMQLWPDYKYTILSSSMEEDLIKFRAIMRAERYLSRRMRINE